MMIIMSVYKT